MPLHYEQLGFGSYNAFETVAGLNVLHCIITLPAIVILVGTGLFKERRPIFKKIFYRLRDLLFNTFYIRYNLETYMMYLIANMLSV